MAASAPMKPPRCLTQPSRAASPKHGHAGEPGTWDGIIERSMIVGPRVCVAAGCVWCGRPGAA
eukprot:4424406-Prymnesium_polylepis.2